LVLLTIYAIDGGWKSKGEKFLKGGGFHGGGDTCQTAAAEYEAAKNIKLAHESEINQCQRISVYSNKEYI